MYWRPLVGHELETRGGRERRKKKGKKRRGVME